MTYFLLPKNGNVVLVELKNKEVQEYTGKALLDVDANSLNVLNYGRVISSASSNYVEGDVVLFQKLAAHKTNFGTPRQYIVPDTEIEAKLAETSK